MPTIGPNLAFHKAQAVISANAEINALRRSLATDIAFQQEAYYKKQAEAEAFIADPTQDMAGLPLLDTISTIRSMTPADLAALWLTTANDQWGPILNQTEIAREKALVAIESASDRSAIIAALAQLDTDIAAIQSQG